MGIGTMGLSEAVRPALSKTWQNNIDQFGGFSIGGPFSPVAQKFLNPQAEQDKQNAMNASLAAQQQMAMQQNQPSQTQAAPSALGMALYPPQEQSPRQAQESGYDSTESKYRTVR